MAKITIEYNVTKSLNLVRTFEVCIEYYTTMVLENPIIKSIMALGAPQTGSGSIKWAGARRLFDLE